jgi:two-component system chemotaxis response regulator CheY
MAILVVDDSRAMRMIIRRELRRAGYQDVVEADSGAAALGIVDQGGIELILSDWNRPDVSGIELLDALRATGNQVAFGFVTSETAADVRRRAFAHGARFVVTKPFTSESLDREISCALGSPGAEFDATCPLAARTIDNVLEVLIGRPVTVRDAPPPDPTRPRGLARYRSACGGPVFGVMDMSLAAGLACALARIPAREAAQWAQAHAFNQSIEANFFEVANVLGGFASPSSERCVLEAVESLAEGELRREMREPAQWHSTVHVEVDGYPSGRLGFLVAPGLSSHRSPDGQQPRGTE